MDEWTAPSELAERRVPEILVVSRNQKVARRRRLLVIGVQLVGVRLVVQVVLVGALAGYALALGEARHDEPVIAT